MLQQAETHVGVFGTLQSRWKSDSVLHQREAHRCACELPNRVAIGDWQNWSRTAGVRLLIGSSVTRWKDDFVR
jgi:hypothetical protein